MRVLATILLVASLLGLVSCAADMPTAPGSSTNRVTGSILDRDGSPMGETRIYFEPRSAGLASPLNPATTASDGTFSLEVREGTYRVYIQPPYNETYPPVSVESFQVPRGGTRFDYRYTGTLVSGVATGPQGDPMSVFHVGANEKNGIGFNSTDGRNGSYSILLQPGTYDFYASPASGAGLPRFRFEATITEQDTTIDLDFSGSEITVHVSLFGSPIPDVIVYAEGTSVSAYSATDIDGNARLYLPPAGYTISVESNVSGMTGPERRYVDVQGDGTVPFDLTGARWDVTVLRSGDHQPVSQAEVYVYEIGGSRYGSSRTDQYGKFAMVVQPNWGHEIRIIPPGSFQAYTVTNVASAADSTFDLLVPIPVPAP